MTTETELLRYDEYGIFDLTSEELLLMSAPGDLSGVSGGVADVACGGNGFCGTLVNVGLCTNVDCTAAGTNGTCIYNGVCV